MRAFTGKVAAITGAGSGMGAALARALAAQGCHLALADRNADALADVQAAVSAYRVNVTVEAVDVSDGDAVHAWAAQTQRAHGDIHLLFNNAGVSVTGSAAAMKMADFEWLININFWGVVHGCRAFLPYLSAAPHAHIINTASIFGVVAVPSQSAYNASKFAVRGYTESLEQELRDTPVRVSCVLPGGVKTNIVRDSRYYPSDNAAPTRDEAIARFESMAGLTSEQAADIILAGVRRDKRRILVGNDARLLDWVARALPTRYSEVIHWLSERNGTRELLS